MEDLSEQSIKKDCPHCDSSSQAFRYPLEELDEFYIICDSHPIVEGHILIIPKIHITCIADFPEDLYKKFLQLNQKVSQFLIKEYNTVSCFEHGILGQTVFRSHVHYLPFKGKITAIIPEGEIHLIKLHNLSQLKTIFKKDKGYLFFSIGKNLWSVDPKISAPRFFRDRFAKALGRPERGNWKKMHTNEILTKEAEKDARETQTKWKNYFIRRKISR